MTAGRWDFWIDRGGTFTDVVVIRDDGTTLVEKVPSTPHDASIGILDGIALSLT